MIERELNLLKWVAKGAQLCRVKKTHDAEALFSYTYVNESIQTLTVQSMVHSDKWRVRLAGANVRETNHCDFHSKLFAQDWS